MTDGLCTRCGTCVGLGGGRVVFEDRAGRYLPRIAENLSDDVVERILSGCSARDVPFPELDRAAFGSASRRDPYLGHASLIAIGYALDDDLRARGSSGGIITAILLWLLERGEIQGAVVTGMDPVEPWRPRTFIARTAQEIADAAQSKYVITSVNEILAEMEGFDGDLAYVGLPCHVHAIRKLQRGADPSASRVRYVIGPYCGNTLHASSIRSLLAAHGVRDLGRIESLRFRDGEWPGNLRIRLRSGETIEMPKFHANYLIPFHIMKRCLVCTDLSNEFTDISGGDAWSPVYEERGKGFSVIIGRSEKGVECLRRMEAEGRIHLAPIEAAEAVRMHTHGFDLKKRGAFIRIAMRRRLGRAAPEYGYRLGGFPPARYALELVISSLFAILGTAPARRMLECVSPRLLGRIFVKLRTIWKTGTRGIKGRELRKGVIDGS
ncbi:MAG: Coenzyme F420 hydrogenase/dehydrogenase, beta subunit C-terminal domain [Planctomycetes bacterium]|nr:Coenzyme F420 hydrogenase/dehydrogenase, beta subunit C-terminal domain [Planctomycetota bacterium]